MTEQTTDYAMDYVHATDDLKPGIAMQWQKAQMTGTTIEEGIAFEILSDAEKMTRAQTGIRAEIDQRNNNVAEKFSREFDKALARRHESPRQVEAGVKRAIARMQNAAAMPAKIKAEKAPVVLPENWWSNHPQRNVRRQHTALAVIPAQTPYKPEPVQRVPAQRLMKLPQLRLPSMRGLVPAE